MSTVNYFPFFTASNPVTQNVATEESRTQPGPPSTNAESKNAVLPASSAHVSNGQSRQRKLLEALGDIAGRQSQSGFKQDVENIAASYALMPGPLGVLARLLIPPDTVIGYGGQTLAKEQNMFRDYVQPGFHDPDSEFAKCLKFLGKVFGQKDVKQLAGDIATAIFRENSPFHMLAKSAVSLRILPLDTPLGCSTLGDELKWFGSVKAGF